MMPRLISFLALALLLAAPAAADAPTAGPRMVAEWEPAHGALIRWPLGIPMDLVAELARDDTLYTLVETSGQESQARTAFASAGVDLGRVVFIRGSLWSMWTRDWGPQAVFDAQGAMAYADPWFDGYPWVPGCSGAAGGPDIPAPARSGRGYEEDDALPAVVAAAVGVPLAPLAAYLTGGNVMTDGLGTAWSTQRMLDENAPYMNAATFFDRARSVMGVDDYRIVLDPEVYGIQHIDCYAKLLDEETVLVKQVPAGHPEAACCDEIAAVFAASSNGFGRPFRVVRVFCDTYDGSAAAAYTNSLILNRKVLVPLFGIAADQDALDVYREAMPGYQVLGFEAANWYDYDALHCRTMGLFDPGMLRLLHARIDHRPAPGRPVRVAAWADDRSGAGLAPGQPVLRWRLDDQTAWSTVAMTPAGNDSFTADIPPQAAGAVVEYRLEAVDASGRRASSPRGADPAAYVFTVDTAAAAPTAAVAALAVDAWPNPFNPQVALRVRVVGETTADLDIVDLRGRVIRSWTGVTSATWDGRDASGRAAPSGVYLARARDRDGRTAVARLVLSR
jgi:agmatine deiminase